MGSTEVDHVINNGGPPAIPKYQVQFHTSQTDGPPMSSLNAGPSSGASSSASQRALRSEALRYATFQGWPHSFLSPRLLSQAGFFYRGLGDQTQCAFCCITISEWEPSDNPMTEHRRHAPNCPFVLELPVGNIPLSNARTEVSQPPTPTLDAPLQALPRMPIGRDICGRFREEFRPNARPERSYPEPTFMSSRAPESSPSPASEFASLPNVQVHQRARHSELTSTEARLKTFGDWPPGLAQRPAQLAEAGFFYMKTGDRVKCFSCDGALRNWEPNDDPWVEHARWFSRCSFLLSMKGEAYVRDIHDTFQNKDPVCGPMSKAQQEPEEKIEEPEDGASIGTSSPPESLSSGSPGSTSSVKDASLCKICYDQQMGIVFLPCGHSLCCPSCAQAFSTCPLCRKTIQATVRAFFSFS